MMLVNDRGNAIRLGAQLTTPGGEGVIYELVSEPSLLAKVYHVPPDPEKTAKLEFLCRSTNPQLTTAAVLPRSLLYMPNDRKSLRGFLMPRVGGKEIHRLYGPRDRHQEFPSAAWDFLVHVAKNCAVAFETLHANGVVMADVNEKNLLVTNEGFVRLIDCDSYQVSHGTHRFLCDVGVPMWTPPELQTHIRNYGYKGLERTPSHDRFGLAVLIFQLLFMGRHPFAGVPDGQKSFEIHEAIERNLFAYSHYGWKLGVKVPPHTLPISSIPDRLLTLFERAFLPGSERPNARPNGQEWILALESLYSSRKTCPHDPSHKFWNGLTACPWCKIISEGGPNFFIAVAVQLGGFSTLADASTFWNLINRVTSSGLATKPVNSTFPIPTVTAVPMPIGRPSAPRISQPQPPSKPAFVILAPPSMPVLPAIPTMARPARTKKTPLTPAERAARFALIGFTIFGGASSAFLSVNFPPSAIFSGTVAIAFLFVLSRNSGAAAIDRQNRRSADSKARADALQTAKIDHDAQLAAHAQTVAQIQQEHARAVADVQAAQAREQARLEAEYNSQLSAYSAQLRLFEAAMAKYDGERRKWDQLAQTRAESVEQARREMDNTWERLNTTLTAYQTKVRDLKKSLQSTYEMFQEACAEESAAMKALEAKKHDAQLRQFLDSQIIGNHRIESIRQTDVATLLANGIESALDITSRMKKVPGIGDKRRQSLLAWRAKCELAFKFNPASPLPQAEVHALRLKYAQLKQLTLVELRSGAGTLSKFESETKATVAVLEAKLPELIRRHTQAVADYSVSS